MKKQTIALGVILTAMAVLLLAACGAPHTQMGTYSSTVMNPSPEGDTILRSLRYVTFEEAATLATDVVVVQFVASRPFGRSLTEFEFIVHERIFGNAADRIFAYVENNSTVSISGIGISYRENELTFTTETQYLLMLYNIDMVYSKTHEDGFMFISDLVLDLNNLSRSTMYNEPLAKHSTGLDFVSQSITRDIIIAYVSELTRFNTPSREPIRSDNLVDIVEGSPYVLIVEIGRPISLSHDAASDWMSRDIFLTTVAKPLKGDMEIGHTVRILFFEDTVQTGERHLVAIEPVTESDPYFYDLTSRNSHFRMDQLDEIMLILGHILEEPPIDPTDPYVADSEESDDPLGDSEADSWLEINVRDDLSLHVGDQFQLEWTVRPIGTLVAGGLIFESSDTNVVEVDSEGVLSANSPGEAAISVTVPIEHGYIHKDFSVSIHVNYD